jgi:predicted O-linked N-acetylglucosamine transferase (SPINDLY family)
MQDAAAYRLRTWLPADVAASPLCDMGQFVSDLERLYRDMWAGWCATQTGN